MSWKKLLFKDFITLQRGFDLPKTQMKEGEVPVLGSNCIIGYHNEAKVAPQGVVTGRSGTLGVVQFIEKDFWPHNTALWVKDFKENIPRFVYYKLQTLHLENFNGGASVPTLNRNVLDTLPVSIPDVDTQSKIATTLSNYDDLIENNRRRIQLLERSLHLLYKEWFVHLRFPSHEHNKIVDGIPEGWKKRTIDKICATIGGGTPSTQNPEYWDGDITWITPTDITKNDCLILLDSQKKITESGLRNSSAKLLPPNTILMTSRASVGFFALIDKEVCTNQGFISIIPHDDLLRMFLLCNLMGRVEEIRSRAGGTTYMEISKSQFRAMEVVIPPTLLLQQFDESASKILQQVSLLKRQTTKLQQARDLLLPKLMSGAISV